MKNKEINWTGSWYSYRFDVKLDTNHGGQTLVLDNNTLIKTPIQIYSQSAEGSIAEGIPNYRVRASWNEMDLEGVAKQMGDFFYIILDDDISHRDSIQKNKNRKKRITITAHNKVNDEQNPDEFYLNAITSTFIHGSIKEATPIGVPVVLEKVRQDFDITNQESEKISIDKAPAYVRSVLNRNKNFISIEGFQFTDKQPEKKNSYFLPMLCVITFLGMAILAAKYMDLNKNLASQKTENKFLNEKLGKYYPILSNLGFGDTTIDSKLQELEGFWISFINSPENWSRRKRIEVTGNNKNGTAVAIWEFVPNLMGGLTIKRYAGNREFEGYATKNHDGIVFYLWEKTEQQDVMPRFSIAYPAFGGKEEKYFAKRYLLIDASWSYTSDHGNIPMPFIEPMSKLEIEPKYKIDTSYTTSLNRVVVFKNADTTFNMTYPKFLNKKEIKKNYPNVNALNDPFLVEKINHEPTYINWEKR